ncbi:MAG: NHLP bacteriocin export ABC transporter permease/ATPase subunit [Lachnospiraceae bacterium]|nr:NHLP bacteriocin export ABC transporter permease/ATPase subunit [Lachnospiraceae bacterium]
MKEIRLKGGKFHITDEAGTVFRSVKGHVLVYIVPVISKDEAAFGRRQFILEAKEGEEITALCHDSDLLGSWRLMLMALDQAVIEVSDEKADEEKLISFAKRAGIKLFSAEDYDSELIERYNRLSVKEEGFIYEIRKEDKNTLKTSANLIYRFFNREKGGDAGYVSEGHPLYDACTIICQREHITIAPFDRIKEASERKITVQDIARVSHFSVREVIPDEDWYRTDSGSLLMFTEEKNNPVPCIPKGPGRYMHYDTKSGGGHRVDKNFAATLKPGGYVFYRPFPEKKMDKLDLFLFGMQKVYKSDIIRLFLLAFLGTMTGLLIPFLNQQVYDRFIPLGDTAGLLAMGAVILSCMLGNISFSIVKNLASFRSMNTMEYAVQNAAIDRLFNLPESFLRQYDAAQLAERVMNISVIYQMLSDSIIQVALTAAFSVAYIFTMFRYSKDLSVMALFLLIILALFLFWLGIRQTKYEEEMLDLNMDAKSRAFQFISGIEKIRISASENRAILKYLSIFTKSQDVNTRKERTTIFVQVIIDIFPTVFSLLLYYMVIRNSISITIGQFTGFTSAFGALSGAVLALVQSFLNVNMVKPLFENVRPVLETMPEVSEDVALPGDISGDVEVSNLTFSYSKEEDPVLSDINLHVNAGEYVAIVGPSGCGKSTLLKLLLGFEKPEMGKIYYDNKDIDEMDKRELRKKFGVVLQDGGMIAGSIFDNIIITAPTTKMERVEKVIEEVGLKDDIDNMPMGIHTVVSEGAGTISGGQRQRILIARALVGKPKIIFLDEATSALDNVTQNMVVETLEKIKATKIVIAHRLSTVKRCDRIIVMDNGRIVEEGNYDELMEKDGFFKELAMRQIK